MASVDIPDPVVLKQARLANAEKQFVPVLQWVVEAIYATNSLGATHRDFDIAELRARIPEVLGGGGTIDLMSDYLAKHLKTASPHYRVTVEDASEKPTVPGVRRVPKWVIRVAWDC